MASYAETLEYLFNRLPVYQHIGKAAYKADLNNTIALMKALDNPELSFKSIHIAGTNGKGSVSSLLASIFAVHGFKTGLYTSPHLKDFRERIRINGEMIPESEVVDFTQRIKPEIDRIQPSFFELTVAMAFDYFRSQQVDIAIIETGMGGRLDSTNVILPELSIITNIGMDHMDFLGDTLSKIASEKAGIIKHNIPVVVGEKHPETDPVFEGKAVSEKAALFYADEAPENWTELFAMKGNYQVKNLATVAKAVEVMQSTGLLKPNKELLERALKEVVQWSGLRGRWEILNQHPLTIADAAHNDHGLKWAMKQLKELKSNHIHFVFGVVNDKDLSKVLPLLPTSATYYFCKPKIIRGLDAKLLQEKSESAGLHGNCYSSVTEAIKAAQTQAKENDVLYIGGSTFVVAEALL
ncbi:MAG: bifunctional folylpolyglutamate synthase/dihydrofolate synthase [Bacteroidia bacterium]|nr:bifunctional folylpolyglutamate synthase/dihydrofolate synthase [Bacteroidia bacterium]